MTYEESFTVELKREINADFKKEIVAFANSEGGEIYVGVDKNGDISAIHDVIDRVERQILHELGCEVCIHMDPIAVGDRKTAECRTMVAQLLAGIDPRLTMHDFRITSGPDHTNLIFDVVRPLDSSYTSEELEERIRQAVTALEGNYYAVITVDTPRV